MGQTQKVQKGKYMYDAVLSLIDYCGDIRKGGGMYNPEFSPNNIRRIILSPDGVIVQLHISAGGKPKILKKTISRQKLEEAIYAEEGYTPGIRSVLADRICGSVEEIIVCGNGIQQFLDVESDISFIQRPDGHCRIKRLAAVIQYQGSIIDFLNGVGNIDNPMTLLRDTDFVRNNCTVIDILGKDWYKNYSTTAKYYMLDRDGSKLNKHFKKIVQDFDAKMDADKKSEFMSERNKGLLSDLEKQHNRSYFLGYGFLSLMKNTKGTQTVLSECVSNLPVLPLLELYKVGIKEKKLPCFRYKDKPKDMSEKQALTENLEKCKLWNQKVYTNGVNCMVAGLRSVEDTYPHLVDTFLKHNNSLCTIRVDGGYTTNSGHVFEGKSFDASVGNMFGVLSFLYLKDFKPSDFWHSLVRR